MFMVTTDPDDDVHVSAFAARNRNTLAGAVAHSIALAPGNTPSQAVIVPCSKC